MQKDFGLLVNCLALKFKKKGVKIFI